MMEAPIYPPAAAFEMPAATAHAVSLDSLSLAELKNMPEAWAIVLKHLPALQGIVDVPMLKPHLGNFTVRSFNTFSKMGTPETFAAMDLELARLPPVQEIAP